MPTMFLIDRRRAGRGKSLPNRQKLIKRIKSFIKESTPQNIGKTGGVTGHSGNAPLGGSSPVKVAGAALEEPWFAYGNDGQNTAVMIGNKEYDRGDEIELPDGDGPGMGNKAGQGDNGEDEFIVHVARDTYLDYFFEDCELPNLVHEKFTEKLDNKFHQAGFSTTGSPAQLSIIRTYKQSLGRRNAMSGPYRREMEELKKEIDEINEILNGNPLNGVANQRYNAIIARMAELEKKLIFIKGFDKSDLRYRKREAKPLKTVDAVLFLLMDISGSMDENKKKIARRWFALLYAFIQRRYPNTELVFIAHTDEAFEMSEDDFFSSRVNGGTTVSPALHMINKIIRERYDPSEVNIYISHASDGDNWYDDHSTIVDEMTGNGHLMNKIQMFSYVEVGKASTGGFYSLGHANPTGGKDETELWKAYDDVRESVTQHKMTLSVLETADECYPVFKKVFKKK